MRIVGACLAFLALVSTVSAGRLEDVGQNKGYSPQLAERLRRKDANPKPQQMVERAAATTTAPTATAPFVKLDCNI
jgi:carboxypeptidase D